jgi:hypothetical protein
MDFSLGLSRNQYRLPHSTQAEVQGKLLEKEIAEVK